MLLLFVTYMGLWPITKWHIIVVTWALMICLMPVALRLLVYISDKHLCSCYNYIIRYLTFASFSYNIKKQFTGTEFWSLASIITTHNIFTCSIGYSFNSLVCLVCSYTDSYMFVIFALLACNYYAMLCHDITIFHHLAIQ